MIAINEELENLKLKDGQQEVYDYLLTGGNCYVAGEAGTGKTTMLEKFIYESRKKGLKVVVCAPTGAAADKIDGTTIHRAFGYPLGVLNTGSEKKTIDYIINGRDSYGKYIKEQCCLTLDGMKFVVNDTMKNADIIIVDEISSVRIDLFDLICTQIMYVNSLRKTELDNGLSTKGPIQLIVSGDFGQTGPVIQKNIDQRKDEEQVLRKLYINYSRGYAIETDKWDLMNFKIMNLTEVIRQDDEEFSKHLGRLRLGSVEDLFWFNNINNEWDEKSIVICGTNKEVNEINNRFLNKLQGKEQIYKDEINNNGDYKLGDADRRNDEYVKLKVGARVMSLVNNKLDGYFNSSLGIVVALNKDSVLVKFDKIDEPVVVERYTWNIKNGENEIIGTITQIPLRLAYAITVHKVQGQTFDKICIKPDIYFDAAMHYTALGRVKTLEGLQFYDLNNKFSLDVKYASGFTKSIMLIHPNIKEFLLKNHLY